LIDFEINQFIFEYISSTQNKLSISQQNTKTKRYHF